ncbi:hypothetical protein FB451DRAFT_1413978 [Mycena latifolia]|nr:hypothetical protein FB451DRAFT_1413978 [Mycena latifolia]
MNESHGGGHALICPALSCRHAAARPLPPSAAVTQLSACHHPASLSRGACRKAIALYAWRLCPVATMPAHRLCSQHACMSPLSTPKCVLTLPLSGYRPTRTLPLSVRKHPRTSHLSGYNSVRTSL